MKKIFALMLIACFFVFSCADPASVRPVNSAVPADTTQIFRGADLDAVASVVENKDASVVVMKGAASDFVVGGHIILDNSDKTPGGRLFEVTAVKDNGDGTVALSVKQGLLEKAVKDANFNFSTTLSNADIVDVKSQALDAKAIKFEKAFDIDLGKANLVSKIEEWAKADYDGSPIKASDVVKLDLSGKMKLTPKVNIDLKIENFKTTYALFDVAADIDTKMIVDAGVNFRKSFAIPLFKLNYAAITVMAGPVPIVIQPQFDVVLHVNPRLQATVTMEVSQNTSLRVCAEKDGVDAEWDTSKSDAKFEVPTFDGVYPKLEAGLGLTLQETAGLCLYGAVGVSVTLNEFADFNALVMDGQANMLDENYEPKAFDELHTGVYKFETGVSANVNVRVSALGFINVDKGVWGDRWVLAQWDLNKTTGYEKDLNTGMYGKWTFPAIQHLIK